MGDLILTEEYQSFRSTVQKKKVVVDEVGNKFWTLYDAGPRSVRSPIIFLPPASGKAEVFFRQIMALSASGFHTVALWGGDWEVTVKLPKDLVVEYPVYWTLKEFNEGFRKLLDHLNFTKVHLFGASLGGFLAQKFAEYTYSCPRVASLILCNSFVDTTVFQQTSSAPMFWMMPAFALKRMVMGGFDKGYVDKDIADSIDFSVACLDSMSQQELASRLTLNCMNSYVQPQNLSDLPVTIIDVYDECALSLQVQEEVYKCFPHAKRAHLKSGGNFPYVSRSAEVNMYLQIHLRAFLKTTFSAAEKTAEEEDY